MSASLGEKPVFAFGQNYVLHSVPYSGSATSFTVDQRVRVATVVDPASGPTATIGSTSNGLTTISLSAGGQNIGGRVVVATAYGKARAGHKAEVGGASV